MVSIIYVCFHHRYHIIIPAGIDGATRLVVFAKASGNNRASTVMEHFIKATAEFGRFVLHLKCCCISVYNTVY